MTCRTSTKENESFGVIRDTATVVDVASFVEIFAVSPALASGFSGNKATQVSGSLSDPFNTLREVGMEDGDEISNGLRV